ncbi:MAG TPA: glycogen/starch synthase [Chthoniobacterales bacterium]|nr:glycogen/starch synthase [Chthoniobacterales bacterium]
MKILMATSEFAPLASTGALGETVRTLAVELKRLGHEVSVAMPLYRSIREGRYELEPSYNQLQIALGEKKVTAEFLTTKTPDGIPVFLVRRDEYFDRSGIYSGNERAYEDNSERFIFFSKAVVELAQQITPALDLIHCHDWPTALIPVFVKDRRLPFLTALSVHDLEYQGSFWSFDFSLTNLPGGYFSPRGIEFYNRLNFLKGGIVYADSVVFPGELVLYESFTQEGGFGLNLVLQENSNRMVGIPFGIDYSVTNPPFEKLLKVTNPPVEKLVSRKLKVDSGNGKAACRQAILNQLELESGDSDLLMVCPIAEGDNRALTHVIPVFDRLLTSNLRFILLGSPAKSWVSDLMVTERKYPKRFAWSQETDARLKSLALAGADLALFPGSLGVRGITALTAMRYGTVPLAGNRGGLRQIIVDFDPIQNEGSGLVYYRDDPEAIWDTVQRAFWLKRQPETWDKLLAGCQAVDFSWPASARSFTQLYADLLRHRQAMPA